MAQFSNMIIVNSGLEMIAESQAGAKLIFTKAKLGDGQTTSVNIQNLTDIISPKMTVNLSSVLAKKPGHVEICFVVDNSTLNSGFFAREVGIFAKCGDDGLERLYGYANAGNYTDYLADKNTPIDAMIVQIDVIVGNATAVGFETDKTIVYLTLKDMEEHNTDENAHADFTGASASQKGNRGFVPAPQTGDQEKFLTGGAKWQPVATKEQAEAGTDDTAPMTALTTKQAIDKQRNAANGLAGLTNNGKLAATVYDFATDEEVKTGTITTKPVSPKGIKSAYLPLAGGTMTGAIAYAVGEDTGRLRVTSVPELGLEVVKNTGYAGVYVIGPSKDSNPRAYLIVGDSSGPKNSLSLTKTQAMILGKNIVRSVNKVMANDSGNVSITSVASATTATSAGKWTTARTVTISDGTHSGTAVQVDGSAAVTLKLPSTIKATLEGNATSATTATKLGTATVGSTTQPVYFLNGTPIAATGAGVITNNNLMQNGYVKFSNGLIMQWGYSETSETTFPTPFSTTNYVVIFGDVACNENSRRYQSYIWGDTIRSTTKMTVTSSIGGTSSTNDGYFWFAIGK